MAILNAHPGSWKVAGFRLPDVGVTEAIQRIVAPKKPLSSQGGSNLFGSTQAQVLGTKAPPAPKPQPTPSPTGGGGGGGGGGSVQSTGGGTPDYSQALQQEPGFEQPNYDAIINPILANLDAEMQNLTGAFPTQEADIRKYGANQLVSAQQQFGAQETGLDTRKTETGTQAESAADEARRQYAEIQQGLQSRYGGTTGTGAFASEQAGVQTLKNIGNIRQTLSSNLQKIEDTRQQVKEIARIQYQDIEDRTSTQVNDAKRDLDSSLAEIRRQKGELQSRKAELASQAFQIYQQTVQQVRAQNAAFKQNLYTAQLDAENKLKLAQQKGSEALSGLSLGGYDLSNFDLSGLKPESYTVGTPRGGQLRLGKPEDEEGAFTF